MIYPVFDSKYLLFHQLLSFDNHWLLCHNAVGGRLEDAGVAAFDTIFT